MTASSSLDHPLCCHAGVLWMVFLYQKIRIFVATGIAAAAAIFTDPGEQSALRSVDLSTLPNDCYIILFSLSPSFLF